MFARHEKAYRNTCTFPLPSMFKNCTLLCIWCQTQIYRDETHTEHVQEMEQRGFDYSMIDRVVDTILNLCTPDLIFLFGSAANGTAKYGSDIDILLVMETDDKPISRGMDILDALDVDTSVDLIVLTPKEFQTFREDSRSFTSHILNSGRPVFGSVRLSRMAEAGR